MNNEAMIAIWAAVFAAERQAAKTSGNDLFADGVAQYAKTASATVEKLTDRVEYGRVVLPSYLK